MTAPAHLLPENLRFAEGWTVQIPMPVHDRGKNRGKPVGWPNANSTGTGGVGSSIAMWRMRKAWRQAAYNALKGRVPAGLGRIYLLVEFRFTDRRHRDPSNYELAAKGAIDALQPLKQYHRENPRTKRTELVIELGVGVVEGDDQRYIMRGPEMPVGEPLGTANPIEGMIILHIYPLR